MSYVAFYLEIDLGGKGFFTHAGLSDPDKEELKASFIECGGQGVKETITHNKRFIISRWKTEEGYAAWLRHPLSKTYIKARDKWNADNHVQSMYIMTIEDPLI